MSMAGRQVVKAGNTIVAELLPSAAREGRATTGQAVTVRVNDRGPSIQGRIVDVSYSAADALGMVENPSS